MVKCMGSATHNGWEVVSVLTSDYDTFDSSVCEIYAP